VAPVLVARGIPPPDSPRLLFAAVAGVAVTCELALIYKAISRGEAYITAPIGALGTAAAVGVGLIVGDPFSVTIAAGLLLALFGGPRAHGLPPPRHGPLAAGGGQRQRARQRPPQSGSRSPRCTPRADSTLTGRQRSST
jgi:hypothetical protein